MTLNFSTPIGLCAVCQHVKVIKSAKGSTFVMCGLAKTDPRFMKYPPLPVLRCGGFMPPMVSEPEEEPNEEDGSSTSSPPE
jgi:hypothetical protein